MPSSGISSHNGSDRRKTRVSSASSVLSSKNSWDSDTTTSPGRQGPDLNSSFGEAYAQSARRTPRPSQGIRLVIGIDYGSTSTGISTATPSSGTAKFDEIRVIQEWGPPMGNVDKVPSVISYSRPSEARERQWGHDLSPNAKVMVNTKLELDVQDNVADELDLIIQSLDGMSNLDFDHVKQARGRPEYPAKVPADIVADYLTKVFEYVEKDVDWFGENIKQQIAVDIVMTVPVSWSYRAKNATFRAIREAGFNKQSFPNLKEYIMVTEPEAAALYTARYLKEEKKERFFKLRESFVLCDGGGGTVDTVSYRVTQLEPTFLFEQICDPTGDKCGSIFIDLEFKKWLRTVLGEGNYLLLDPDSEGQAITPYAREGRAMRHIMREFDLFKREFKNDGRDIKMDLPEPLNTLTIPGRVDEGELIITNEEMEEFFGPSVESIVELVRGQKSQVEKKRSRVKNILLVGGFAESPYLQELLDDAFGMDDITVRKPDTSWSAVVQGAAMYGVEKKNYKELSVLRACPCSYGILLDQPPTDGIQNNVALEGEDDGKEGELTWLIYKDDLLLTKKVPLEPREFILSFDPGSGRKFDLPLYSYAEEDHLPTRYETAHEELGKVTTLQCDLSRSAWDAFNHYIDPNTGKDFYSAILTLEITVDNYVMKLEAWFNKSVVGSVLVKDIHEMPSAETKWK